MLYDKLLTLALFAEQAPVYITDPPKPNGATDPASWAELAKVIGPVWFFAVLCFVSSIVIIGGIVFLGYKIMMRYGGGFASKCLEKLDKFFDDILKTTKLNARVLGTISQSQNVTKINVANLCDAGHSFANAIQKIGNEIGIDVESDCDRIREKLKTVVTIEVQNEQGTE